MKSAVYIASINRPKQLKMAVNSVPKEYRVLVHCHSIEKDANINFDRDVEIFEYPGMSRDDRSNLAMKKLDGYNVLGINDDTRIFPDTIKLAEEKMYSEFGGSMGMCGIKAHNVGETISSAEFAFSLFGNDWLNTFIDRKVCSGLYEQYYIDYEWWVNAKARNCWTFCEDAELMHNHLFKDRKNQIEFCDVMIRDRDLFRKRMKEGKCWGITEGCHNPIEKCEIIVREVK